MKTKLHPKYSTKTTITCSCGNQFEVGSTAEDMTVEVCSACHPYYTGKQKLVDVAGRIDKFNKRLEEAAKADKKNAEKKSKKSGSNDQGENIVRLGS